MLKAGHAGVMRVQPTLGVQLLLLQAVWPAGMSTATCQQRKGRGRKMESSRQEKIQKNWTSWTRK